MKIFKVKLKILKLYNIQINISLFKLIFIKINQKIENYHKKINIYIFDKKFIYRPKKI